MLVALLRNWQLVLYVVVGLLLAGGGWIVKSKFARAAEADRLQSELNIANATALDRQHKIERAEADKATLSADLAAERAKAKEQGKTIIKVVRERVTSNPDCDVPVEVLKALNRARGQPE